MHRKMDETVAQKSPQQWQKIQHCNNKQFLISV